MDKALALSLPLSQLILAQLLPVSLVQLLPLSLVHANDSSTCMQL